MLPDQKGQARLEDHGRQRSMGSFQAVHRTMVYLLGRGGGKRRRRSRILHGGKVSRGAYRPPSRVGTQNRGGRAATGRSTNHRGCWTVGRSRKYVPNRVPLRAGKLLQLSLPPKRQDDSATSAYRKRCSRCATVPKAKGVIVVIDLPTHPPLAGCKNSSSAQIH